jgi:hypothetical protein
MARADRSGNHRRHGRVGALLVKRVDDKHRLKIFDG